MEYYWKKKTIVSFILAMFVMLMHNSAVDQYIMQSGQSDGMTTAVAFWGHLCRDTFERVAVPLFFMISGVTFFYNYNRKKYFEKLKSRVVSLVIPYLAWNSIVMMFYIFCSYTPLNQYFVGREKFVISVSNVLNAIFLYKCNYVFWFMFNLIVYVLATPLFDILTSKKWLAHISVIVSLLMPLVLSEAFEQVKLDSGSVVFYMTGCMIGKYYLNEFAFENKTQKTKIISVLICVLCITLQILNLSGMIVLTSVPMHVMLIVFCIAFWRAVDCIVEKIDVKPYMKYSFFIYALHPDIQAVFVKIIYLAGPEKMWMAYPNVVISYFATVITIILFAYIINKKMPVVYRILSGGR